MNVPSNRGTARLSVRGYRIFGRRTTVFRIVSSTRLVIAMLTGLALALTGITAATAAAAAPAGTVVGWGNNGSGQATPPAGLTGVTAIAAGEMYSLALTSDGTVVGWGYNLSGQATPPAGLTGVTAIAAGYYHGLALKLSLIHI